MNCPPRPLPFPLLPSHSGSVHGTFLASRGACSCRGRQFANSTHSDMIDNRKPLRGPDDFFFKCSCRPPRLMKKCRPGRLPGSPVPKTAPGATYHMLPLTFKISLRGTLVWFQQVSCHKPSLLHHISACYSATTEALASLQCLHTVDLMRLISWGSLFFFKLLLLL